MIPEAEREAGLLAYEQTLAFAALRRKRLPFIYVLFPVALLLAGAGGWRAGSRLLAAICGTSAIFFALFASWNWRRLRALDLRNRALLAHLHAEYGDDLPWLEVERQQLELKNIQAELARRRSEGQRLVINEIGFEIRLHDEISGLVKWPDVNSIVALKRDLFTVDLICFEFYQDGATEPVEINEEMNGFEQIENLLPITFAGFDQEWRLKVVPPAFAANITELWRR